MAKTYHYNLDRQTGGKGLVSTVLAGISIALFLGLLTACTALDGQAGEWAGAVGMSGMLTAFFGVAEGLSSFRERRRTYGFSKAGTITSGVMVAVWFILYCRGLTL